MLKFNWLCARMTRPTSSALRTALRRPWSSGRLGITGRPWGTRKSTRQSRWTNRSWMSSLLQIFLELKWSLIKKWNFPKKPSLKTKTPSSNTLGYQLTQTSTSATRWSPVGRENLRLRICPQSGEKTSRRVSRCKWGANSTSSTLSLSKMLTK